ncbi:hypothetical protein [Halovivax limisalsi]|uniref:hypothetical protein n=1 Tax=Halovivax limisalsi TaxID=1453760 RepID=UPI001FFC8810|nr:hypothetical protein [Halovivax limisalsi]
MITNVAQHYSDLFAPEFFVLVCLIALVGHEWRAGSTEARAGPARLGAQLGVIALAWALGLAIYLGVPALFETTPEWAPDATGSAGLGLGMGLVWGVWRRRAWGGHVPTFALALIVVTVPHLLITPFWDVSSHVTYALVPAGVVVLVAMRFLPLGLIAIGMVPARPLAGAHTWPEAIGGVVLSVAVLAAIARLRFGARDGSAVGGTGA